LLVGDRIALEDGWAEVEGLVDTGSWETVYNFRIAEFHTYFVGCDEWGFSVWAHNANCVDYSEAGIRALGKQTSFDKAALQAAGLSPSQITKVRGLARKLPSDPLNAQSQPLLAKAGYRGQAGDPAHQATIGRLETAARAEFPNDVVNLGTSMRKIPGGGGLRREPDVWVADAVTRRVKKVYEAARKEPSTGDWVLRERAKQTDYVR